MFVRWSRVASRGSKARPGTQASSALANWRAAGRTAHAATEDAECSVLSAGRLSVVEPVHSRSRHSKIDTDGAEEVRRLRVSIREKFAK